MKQYLFIVLFLGIRCYKEWWENSNVPDLTKNNFFDVVGTDKWVFVKFYTTWCGYCRKMATEFDKLYEQIEKKRDNILIRRLEGDSNEEITNAYDIHSFPKLVLYKPGSDKIYALYKGQRTAEEMMNFLNKYAIKNELTAEVNPNTTINDSKKTEKNDKLKKAANSTERVKTNARKNTTKNTRKANNTKIENNKNKTKTEILSINDHIKINNTDTKIKNDEIDLRQVDQVQNIDGTSEIELQEIQFMKEEIIILKEQLNSVKSDGSISQQFQKPFDYILIAIIVMILLAVILTIKRIFNKLKIL
jgi:thioredoxin 1